jgi:tripartite-type tricarboxylate transporter receptor subunit TctC
MPYDPVKDLTPIAQVAPTFYALVVPPSVPAKSVKELVALALAQPGKITFGSSGVGGPPHLAGELLKSLTGTDMVHVPYKGTGPAVAALLGGQISFMFGDALASLPQARAGKLRALAISSAARVPFAPELPTVAESGVPGYEAIGWSGLLAPARTPRPVIAKINAEVIKILKMPDVQARLSSDGSLFGENTPEQFGQFIKAEIAKWGKVVKASGARAD